MGGALRHNDNVADDGRITFPLPFKSEARPANNFQTAKQRLFDGVGVVERGGEGGGLVCEENKGSRPIFHFFLQPHTPNSITQSTLNPLMDDEGLLDY